MTFYDNLETILEQSDGETVAAAIAECLTYLVENKYTDVDIDEEVSEILQSPYGKLIKRSIYDALLKMSREGPYVRSLIVELALSEYEGSPHTEVLYGIRESNFAYAVELDSNYKPTKFQKTFSSYRDVQRFLMNNLSKKYHIYLGADMSDEPIPDSLFSGESALYSITIPDGFTTVSDTLFYNSGLAEANLSNTVTTIEDGAFASCDNLTHIRIPRSVTSINEYAFLGCNGITFDIEAAENQITGAPWGATNATINWLML